MIATLRRSGVSWSEWAIAGKAVAMTVESRFCMKSAQATISGTSTGREASPFALARGAISFMAATIAASRP